MTVTSWPYVDQSTTDIEYSRLFREFKDDGVVGSIGSNELAVSADSSGMSVKVQAGSLIIRGYIMRSTAVETLSVLSADTQARIDQVIAELNLSAPTVQQRVTLKVLKGTPGANPVPLALTQTDTAVYQLGLANINVGASVSTIAANAVIDRRSWIGQDVGEWKNDDLRPKNPRKWKMGRNEQRNTFETWTGSAWVSITDWSTMTGVPTSFPPSSHNHPITGVTGLEEALNTLLPKADPTFTGTLRGPNYIGQVNGINFFVGTGTPVGAEDGDVWFSA